jgi:hypothetical protein
VDAAADTDESWRIDDLDRNDGIGAERQGCPGHDGGRRAGSVRADGSPAALVAAIGRRTDAAVDAAAMSAARTA